MSKGRQWKIRKDDKPKRPRKSRKNSKSPVPNDLHPALVGDFDPDVRPFTWPRRPRVKRGPEPEQPDLFPVDFFGEPL